MSDLGLFGILGSAVLAGSIAGQQLFCGGWARRAFHNSCGWFDSTGIYYLSMCREKPCPRCGRTDGEWKMRVGRPILPFIWQWRDDETASAKAD